MNKKKETIERIIIKVPKSVADYFRAEFPHGRRSEFVVKCIMDYKKQKEIKNIEDELREVGKNRQK